MTNAKVDSYVKKGLRAWIHDQDRVVGKEDVLIELQIQEIEYRINSRLDRMFELVTDNNWENDAYFIMLGQSIDMAREKQDLHARVEWRDKRILELETENDFDTLALSALRGQWVEAWGGLF